MRLITRPGAGGIDGCARLGSSGRLYPKNVTTKASMLMCVYWTTKISPLLFFSTLDITESVLIQQAERKHMSSVPSSTQGKCPDVYEDWRYDQHQQPHYVVSSLEYDHAKYNEYRIRGIEGVLLRSSPDLPAEEKLDAIKRWYQTTFIDWLEEHSNYNYANEQEQAELERHKRVKGLKGRIKKRDERITELEERCDYSEASFEEACRDLVNLRSKIEELNASLKSYKGLTKSLIPYLPGDSDAKKRKIDEIALVFENVIESEEGNFPNAASFDDYKRSSKRARNQMVEEVKNAMG